MYPNLTSKGSSRKIAQKLSLSWNLIWNWSWFSNFSTTSNWWKSASDTSRCHLSEEPSGAKGCKDSQGEPSCCPMASERAPLPGLVTFTFVTREAAKKPKPSMPDTLQLGLICKHTAEAQVWHPYRCAESRQSRGCSQSISNFLLAIPVPLTGSSVPEHFESEEVEDATETMHFFLLFSLLRLSVLTLKIFKEQGKLWLFPWWMSWLMQTVKIHFRFAAAHYLQIVNKTNIQDKSDHQQAASRGATMTAVRTLKHAPNLERIKYWKTISAELYKHLRLPTRTQSPRALSVWAVFMWFFAPTPSSAPSAGSSVGAEICQLGMAEGGAQERQKGCREGEDRKQEEG